MFCTLYSSSPATVVVGPSSYRQQRSALEGIVPHCRQRGCGGGHTPPTAAPAGRWRALLGLFWGDSRVVRAAMTPSLGCHAASHCVRWGRRKAQAAARLRPWYTCRPSPSFPPRSAAAAAAAAASASVALLLRRRRLSHLCRVRLQWHGVVVQLGGSCRCGNGPSGSADAGGRVVQLKFPLKLLVQVQRATACCATFASASVFSSRVTTLGILRIQRGLTAVISSPARKPPTFS